MKASLLPLKRLSMIWKIPMRCSAGIYLSLIHISAVNIPFLIDKATAAEAWHYVGAARVIRAYGFMLMTDLYGEMPYKSKIGRAHV